VTSREGRVCSGPFIAYAALYHRPLSETVSDCLEWPLLGHSLASVLPQTQRPHCFQCSQVAFNLSSGQVNRAPGDEEAKVGEAKVRRSKRRKAKGTWKWKWKWALCFAAPLQNRCASLSFTHLPVFVCTYLQLYAVVCTFRHLYAPSCSASRTATSATKHQRVASCRRPDSSAHTRAKVTGSHLRLANRLKCHWARHLRSGCSRRFGLFQASSGIFRLMKKLGAEAEQVRAE